MAEIGVADVGKGNTVENYVVTVLVLSTAENARGLEERVDFTFEVEKANSGQFGVLNWEGY